MPAVVGPRVPMPIVEDRVRTTVAPRPTGGGPAVWILRKFDVAHLLDGITNLRNCSRNLRIGFHTVFYGNEGKGRGCHGTSILIRGGGGVVGSNPYLLLELS